MRYVFLVLEDHPYGRELLDRARREKLPPAAVIVEASDVAAREAAKFTERLAGQTPAPRFVRSAAGIPVHTVANHNDRLCLELIRELSPDWVVLGGTRIIRGDLLKHKILNVHPGLLPWMKGSSPEAWSILEDIPLGVTCHRVDAGIDTGPILLRLQLDYEPGDTYEALVWKNSKLASEALVRGLNLLRAGEAEFVAQTPGVGVCRSAVSEAELSVVSKKLSAGEYRPEALLKLELSLP